MTWKVRQHENGTYLVYDDEDWYVMSCQDERRAQLVAQAPVLLEALEAIVELDPAYWCQTEPGNAVCDQCKATARAAIAAVKGEQVDEKA